MDKSPCCFAPSDAADVIALSLQVCVGAADNGFKASLRDVEKSLEEAIEDASKAVA